MEVETLKFGKTILYFHEASQLPYATGDWPSSPLYLSTLPLPKLNNIEGITWGPKLENGHDCLVLVSDNNIHPTQVTQFLAFDANPK